MGAPRQLSREVVISITSRLTLDDGVFLVGGQALNLWAERYAPREPALREHGPYTSNDIDYFGHRHHAVKLAEALNGEVIFPEINDSTPNSAIVRVAMSGQVILIDFINGVLGIGRTGRLKRNAVELELPLQDEDGYDAGTISIPVMHPVHCMISRIANVFHPATRRTDDTAIRQLRAAPLIVKAYIDEVLEAGDDREATDCLQEIFSYLKSDITGKHLHTLISGSPHLTECDPLAIIRSAGNNPGFDERYRARTIPNLIRQIEKRREARRAAHQNEFQTIEPKVSSRDET